MIQADTLVTTAATLPGATFWVLLVGMLSGAVGAFAADLATDGGRLEKVGGDNKSYALGFVGKIVIGAVAAVVVLSVNPPEGSWLILIGTALVAGIGGEAIVLGFVATGRLESEQKRNEDLTKTALNQWDGLLEAVRTAGRGSQSPVQVVAEEHARAAKATLEGLKR